VGLAIFNTGADNYHMQALADNGVDKDTQSEARETLTAIGLMSGTSMDGIDIAIIESDGTGVSKRGAFATYPYAVSLRQRLIDIIGHKPDASDKIATIARDVTDAHAEAVEDFLGRAGIERASVDLIGFHGQTVFPDPDNGITCQLGDGARLSQSLGIDVVSDFRSADVAAGGQGAPLAPLYHAALAAPIEPPLGILNLGGVGNLTWISADGGIIAFDTGPANALVDDWMLRHTGAAMDEDGKAARQGTVNDAVLAALLDNSYFAAAYPKSLDRDHFDASPVEALSLEDGAATLIAFSAEAVGLAQAMLPSPPTRWVVTGGGRHNPAMMAALRRILACPVEPVEAVGWSGDAIEAQAFAYLAVRSVYGLPLSLPTTTGVSEPMTGGVVHRIKR
jgi:anhydro-N-acetylmuramic acid kinase